MADTTQKTFRLFPGLPPEIRQHIWRAALSQCWAFTRLQRAGQGVKLVGEVHRSVGQSCREARDTMHAMQAETQALGRIDFARHVFFFRDAKSDGALLTAADHGDLLGRLQHVVVYPRDWANLWATVDMLKRSCGSLRSLVVVAPWFDPAAMPAERGADSYAPFEDWSAVVSKTPTELSLSPLREALERGADARNDDYRARLDEAAASVTDPDMAATDHVFRRTRLALEKLEQAAGEFPGAKPRLFLRTKEELSATVGA